MYLIKYGTKDKNIDVTEIVYNNKKLIKSGIIHIPSGDGNRSQYFTDPVEGVLKSIFIVNNVNNVEEYDVTKNIYIDTIVNKIYTEDADVPEYIKELFPNVMEKLKNIHQKLKLDYGSFNDELPEQMMAVRYLTGKEKVLELGGNIGRNSLVIAYILNQHENSNFVSLECEPEIAEQLRHNHNINKLNFFIEPSALSKRKLIQKNWETFANDIVLDGYKPVSTINLDELYAKYNINFDTLVIDCEGAFYYILMDMPEILKNVNLIIMENDYWNFSKKQYVDSILYYNRFYQDYVEAGGWGPCYNNFFEVWKRDS